MRNHTYYGPATIHGVHGPASYGDRLSRGCCVQGVYAQYDTARWQIPYRHAARKWGADGPVLASFRLSARSARYKS